VSCKAANGVSGDGGDGSNGGQRRGHGNKVQG
jgi:hypothetical protein